MSRWAPPSSMPANCATTRPSWWPISAAAPATSRSCASRSGAAASRRRPLGHAGIGIAGDAFDYRIIDNVVSPRLGKGASYRSFDKTLTMPNGYYANFARWNQLADDEDERRSEGARRTAARRRRSRPARASSSTSSRTIWASRSIAPSPPPRSRCRRRDEAEFRFQHGELAIERDDHPARFRRLDRRGCRADRSDGGSGAGGSGSSARDEIDKVFLTGGSSFIPAIWRVFGERFGAAS